MSTDRRDVVRTRVVVDAPIERAFAVVHRAVRRLQAARSTTCSASPIAETAFEPHVGGHIYDRGEDGSECRWARVLAYEPPDRVVFSWDISPSWQLEADEANDQRGRGPLHRRDARPDPGRAGAPPPRPARPRLGGVRDGVADDGGWPLYLIAYADVARRSS